MIKAAAYPPKYLLFGAELLDVLANGVWQPFLCLNAKTSKSMETTSINLGQRPASVEETPFSLHVAEVMLTIQQKVNSSSARQHALPATGSALLALGVLLSSGAQTVGAALICAAVILAGAGILYVDNKRKGGEA